MKKVSFFLTLLLLVAKIVFAQTTVTGTVKDTKGNPLHFAFLRDKQNKHATYTDSLGAFILTASLSSKLEIDCYGFKDTIINIAGRNDLQIVLNEKFGFTVENTNTDNKTNQNRFLNEDAISQHTLGQHGIVANQGAIFPSFSIKEQTEGSRYFFQGWMHGYVTNSADSIIQNPNFSFNYDKIGGGLLLSQDKKSAIEVEKSQIKSFTVFDNFNQSFTFENAPQIDKTHYVQVLSSGENFKIYKQITTKFVKSDYQSNGISSSGNNYDEYVNTDTYYILNLKTNQLQKIDLKKKSIKSALASNANKADKFIADHSSDPIDDSYLSNLGSYMNE